MTSRTSAISNAGIFLSRSLLATRARKPRSRGADSAARVSSDLRVHSNRHDHHFRRAYLYHFRYTIADALQSKAVRHREGKLPRPGAVREVSYARGFLYLDLCKKSVWGCLATGCRVDGLAPVQRDFVRNGCCVLHDLQLRPR